MAVVHDLREIQYANFCRLGMDFASWYKAHEANNKLLASRVAALSKVQQPPNARPHHLPSLHPTATILSESRGIKDSGLGSNATAAGLLPKRSATSTDVAPPSMAPAPTLGHHHHLRSAEVPSVPSSTSTSTSTSSSGLVPTHLSGRQREFGSLRPLQAVVAENRKRVSNNQHYNQESSSKPGRKQADLWSRRKANSLPPPSLDEIERQLQADRIQEAALLKRAGWVAPPGSP